MTPAGMVQRRIFLAAELFYRRHGQAATLAELRRMLGLSRTEISGRVRSLERNGLVTFSEEPRSLRVTAQGLELALNGRGK